MEFKSSNKPCCNQSNLLQPGDFLHSLVQPIQCQLCSKVLYHLLLWLPWWSFPNKILQTGRFQQQMFVFSQFWGSESSIKVPSRWLSLSSCSLACRWLPSHGGLMGPFPHMAHHSGVCPMSQPPVKFSVWGEDQTSSLILKTHFEVSHILNQNQNFNIGLSEDTIHI